MKSSTLRILAVLVLMATCLDLNRGQNADLPPAPNTKLSLELLSPISTMNSKKDDKFSCRVLTPAEYAGAVVEGHIRSLKRSGKANKESKMDLAFDRITSPGGQTADFSATVVEVFDVANVSELGRADNEGTVRRKSTTVKTSVKRAATGAVIGAIIGGVLAGGKGAAVGAAIGAGVGATSTLASKGADLEFRTGTQFTVEATGRSRKKKDAQSAKASVVSSPDLPSTKYRAYSRQYFGIRVPENWNESSKVGSVSFAPLGGTIDYQGRPSVTHGVMAGVVNSGSQDINTASDQLVNALLKGNSFMQRNGQFRSEGVGTRQGLSLSLSGASPLTGRPQIVTIHTTLLENGSLFYFITVIPEQAAAAYREAFSNILLSIQFQ